jgi:tRNA modification GTPase
MNFPDSIVALASGRLPAGIAVIRLSGTATRFALETICGSVPAPREAVYRSLKDQEGRLLDRGLVIFFPGPASFTGEDVAEFHVHGGKAGVAALISRLTSLPGVRQAEAGEFTRRAFLNGKLDLAQTEALADLIDAETEAQRRFALRNAEGAQGRLYSSWRERLLHARAMIEAEIDFADEDDVPGSVAQAVLDDLAALGREIQAHADGYSAVEIIRDGYEVVILGAPNAGKSSLLNALAKRDVAIVADEPGTTRDLLEVSLELGGLYVRLVDTAGLRDADGTVEKIGIERAKVRAQTARLVLLLEDMSSPIAVLGDLPNVATLRIGTKLDLAPTSNRHYDVTISTRTGEGLENLVRQIASRAAAAAGAYGQVLPSRLRHVELLKEASRFLQQGLDHQERELQAEAFRLAADHLGRIVGSTDVEDMLDVIFSKFCIGK